MITTDKQLLCTLPAQEKETSVGGWETGQALLLQWRWGGWIFNDVRKMNPWRVWDFEVNSSLFSLGGGGSPGWAHGVWNIDWHVSQGMCLLWVCKN